jgi:hypothetical protein
MSCQYTIAMLDSTPRCSADLFGWWRKDVGLFERSAEPITNRICGTSRFRQSQQSLGKVNEYEGPCSLRLRPLRDECCFTRCSWAPSLSTAASLNIWTRQSGVRRYPLRTRRRAPDSYRACSSTYISCCGSVLDRVEVVENCLRSTEG